MSSKINYLHKLFDPRWKTKRKEILKRDNYQCTICYKTEGKLIVHHKQYHYIKRLNTHIEPWNYDNKYMITLCESCHTRGHNQFKIPIKYI